MCQLVSDRPNCRHTIKLSRDYYFPLHCSKADVIKYDAIDNSAVDANYF